MPKVSIIIPIYNCEKYLSRCLNSVLQQTYSDFEVILIDDGSTDSSLNICMEYQNLDNRIQVLHKENGGQSSARNLGIEKASSEYICFVDSDDWITKDCIEFLYDLLTNANADVVSANYQIAYSENCNIENQSFLNKTVEGNVEILKFYLVQDKLNQINDFSPCAKLYRKELFNTVRFPEGQIYEDNITNFKILQNCSRYIKSSKKIYYYFQNQNSTTKSPLKKKHLALIDVANEQIRLSEKYQNKELFFLTQRKLGMSYFSLLTMYVRYGTDMTFSEIKKLVHDYKKNKKLFLISEKSLIIHILSFFMCININFIRKMYELYNSFLKTIKLGGNS